jgi:hypothetical protein
MKPGPSMRKARATNRASAPDSTDSVQPPRWTPPPRPDRFARHADRIPDVRRSLPVRPGHRPRRLPRSSAELGGSSADRVPIVRSSDRHPMNAAP